ncbi:hypothetical protein [Campylobacter geochelonis]|nr:hypothetical protein [Campylobacter geochelonis]
MQPAIHERSDALDSPCRDELPLIAPKKGEQKKLHPLKKNLHFN